MPMKGFALSGEAPIDRFTAKDIPTDAKSREFVEFRDRAAYVYLTGTFPTHVRKHFTNLLKAATEFVRGPSSVDKRFGHIQITPDVAGQLKLDEHRMVRKVRELVENEGFVIAQSSSIKERRPYGRINLVQPSTKREVTVHVDGKVTDRED